MSLRRLSSVAFAALLTGLLLALAPASVTHAGDGKGHRSPVAHAPTGSGTVTEDNDGDGTANTPDPDGDSDNAHPSGTDKHHDNGITGNSRSDPDDDENQGADKPDAEGGVDTLDQDGNNGCGNDDDFEDDNNGQCVGRRGAAPTTITSTSTTTTTTTLSPVGGGALEGNENGSGISGAVVAGLNALGIENAEVTGVTLTNSAVGGSVTAADAGDPVGVGGAAVQQATDVLPTELARSGAAILGLVLAGAAAIAAGSGLRRASRSRG